MVKATRKIAVEKIDDLTALDLSKSSAVRKVFQTESAAYRGAVDVLKGKTARAAYVTDAAVESGLLVTGDAGRGEMNASDWAESWAVPNSTVTHWKNVGRFMRLGEVTPGSDAFNALAFTYGGTKSAVTSLVRKMTGPDDVAAIVAEITKQNNERAAGKRAAGGSTNQTDKSGDKSDAPADVPSEVTDPLERVKLVLALLDRETKGVMWTREQWAVVESGLDKIVTREVTLLGKREAQAKADADKGAAPIRAPRKSAVKSAAKARRKTA